jgi:hypothetical protein
MKYKNILGSIGVCVTFAIGSGTLFAGGELTGTTQGQLDQIINKLGSFTGMTGIDTVLENHGETDYDYDIADETEYPSSRSGLEDKVLYAIKLIRNHVYENSGLPTGQGGAFYKAIDNASTITADQDAYAYAYTILDFVRDYCFTMLDVGKMVLSALQANSSTVEGSWSTWKEKINNFYKALCKAISGPVKKPFLYT